MLDKLKQRRQARTLRLLNSVARQKRIANLDHVHDIGIIFTVGSEQEWNKLYSFARDMEKAGKRVYLIGFQSTKTQIDYIFSHPQTSILHEKENLTFCGLPKEGVVDGFTSRHYDLLVDATPDHPFIALYIAARSLADLKVTYCQLQQPNTTLEQTFDLLIRDERSFETGLYINLIKQYLSIIKK